MGFFTDKYEAEARKKFESKNSGLSFDTFYSKHKQEYFDRKGSNAIWDYHYNNDRSSYGKKLDSDIDNWISSQKKANEGKPVVPEGPIESESTQQGSKPIESQSTAKGEKPSVKPVEPTPPPQSAVGVTVPSMQDHSSNTEGNTPSANRKNKRRGKRGFMITREQGQGLNI